MADIDPSGVQIVESATPDNVQTGDQNGFLSLASSLKDAEPAVGDFLQNVGSQLQKRAADKAQADAFSQSGEAFGNAVREGKIEPTQNPWYIQAYNRDSAAIRSKADVAGLVDQSQTWAEQNDPKAFEAKFNQQLGQIAQNYTGLDSSVGFQQAAAPLAKQAIDANVEYNVQRIQQERKENASTLMTTAVQDTATASGGKLDPNAAYAALKPFVDQWIATGGTVPQARLMMLNAIVAAGANTGNSSLLDVLNTDMDGHGALANMSNAQGQPVAEDLMRSRYYIERLAGQDPAKKAQIQKVYDEGSKGADMLQQKYGFDLLRGKVSEGDMLNDLQASGVSPQGAAEALRQMYAQVHDVGQLGTSLVGLRDQDPQNALTVAGLYEVAMKNGSGPTLEAAIQQGLRKGIITSKDVTTIDEKAAARDLAVMHEGKEDARHADSEGRIQGRWAHEQLGQHTDALVDTVAGAYSMVGDNKYVSGPARAQLKTALAFARESTLASSKGNTQAASQAMEDTANQLLNTPDHKARVLRYKIDTSILGKSPTGSSAAYGGSSNPRGGNM